MQLFTKDTLNKIKYLYMRNWSIILYMLIKNIIDEKNTTKVKIPSMWVGHNWKWLWPFKSFLFIVLYSDQRRKLDTEGTSRSWHSYNGFHNSKRKL